MSKKPLLETHGLVIGYLSATKKAFPVAGPLSLDIHEGQLICLIGPNGSGKSTLLRTLANLQPALQGSREIDGLSMSRTGPGRLAKKISLVLTDPVRDNNLTVQSLVALGRYPYSGWLGRLREKDKKIVIQAIETAGMSAFTDRKLSTLSDGESQKVMLARALAQDTALMMLDEPTAHLDLPSRIQLMQLLHRLARQTGKGILVSTHELDLALQVADEAWLLQTGGEFHRGAPEDLVLNGTFETAFDKEGIRFDKATGTFAMHQDPGKPIALRSEEPGLEPALFWTKRALSRSGFAVVMSKDTPVGRPECSIHISADGDRITWTFTRDIAEGGTKNKEIHGSIASLLQSLSSTFIKQES